MVRDTPIREALREAQARLAAIGCPSPRVDAEHLAGHVLGLSRTALYTHPERELTSAEEERLEELVARRERREPLAYVLGEWGFRRLTLEVDRRVLVPRPETEVVVERSLALLAGLPEPDVLDVGVGSGAIALAIADEHPGARITAIDSSPDALAVARANAERLGFADRVVLREQDAGDGLGESAWDLVVSNPPYVEADELPGLEPEVRDWEPREALVGSGVTEVVAGAAYRGLRPRGRLVLEVADGKAGAVSALLAEAGFVDVVVTRDLAGRERVVDAQRPV